MSRDPAFGFGRRPRSELAPPPRSASEGIPEPELIDQPGASWRSRIIDDEWQVNSGHREFRSIVDRPVLKLRYLALLFAKEVVLRSSQDPRLESHIEDLVEIAAYADRNLSWRGKLKKGNDGEEAG